MSENRKCQCKEILGIERIYLHLNGCYEDYSMRDYEALSWWKRVFTTNPRKIYEIHKKQTGVY